MDEFVSGNWQGSKAFFEQVRARCYSSWPAPLLRVLRLPRALFLPRRTYRPAIPGATCSRDPNLTYLRRGVRVLSLQALAICPRDKPSQRILMHMDTPENHPDYGLATTPFVAPEGWPGYHILLSK